MGIIVFSDIHGNYDNLNKFRESLRGFNYSKAYCLGDIIHDGKNYDENRTIDLLKEMRAICIKGNHDLHEDAPKIVPANKEFLKNLETKIEVGDILFTHIPVSADKRLISSNDYRDEAEAIAKQYPHVKFVFEGHNHDTRIYNFQNHRLIELDQYKKQELKEGLYLISPGGLGIWYGKPNTFAVFDRTSVEIWTLDRLVNLAKIRDLLVLFEEWMPNMLGDGWSYSNFREEAEKLDPEFKAVADLLFSYELPENDEKQYCANFSQTLAELIRSLTAPEVFHHYDVRDPVALRHFHLSSIKKKVKGVKTHSGLRIIS